MCILQPVGKDNWETIDDLKPMEAILLNHSQDHFARAHGTEFTIKPLKSQLQYNGSTSFGDKVTQGSILMDMELPLLMQLLLKHQKSKLLPGEDPTQPLEFEKSNASLLEMEGAHCHICIGETPQNLQITS